MLSDRQYLYRRKRSVSEKRSLGECNSKYTKTTKIKVNSKQYICLKLWANKTKRFKKTHESKPLIF